MTAASPAPAPSSRGRIIAARALLVLGVLLTVVTILSTYVKREALDEGQFKQTSQELIASPAIQEQVAATLVDTLYANVDVSAELTSKLPDNLQGLAAPIAGISRELVDRGAKELLARPKASGGLRQGLVALAAAAGQGPPRRHETVRDRERQRRARPPAARAEARRSLRLHREPGARRSRQDSAQVTILKSDDLKTAQDVTHWLEQVANFVWILALACWVGAIWLARGRRRQEVRSLGIGLFIVGVLVLLSRWLAGKYIVDNIVQTDSVRPAVSDVWQIITNSLAAAGWVALSVGILIAIGAWLVGPGDSATSARTALAPALRGQRSRGAASSS